VTTIDGLKYELDPTSYVDLLVATERFEPEVLAEIGSVLSKGDWAVDLGANIGGATLRMAAACGHAGGVIAYEPNPSVAQSLTRNLELNEFKHVTVVERAAGDSQSTIELFLPSHKNLGTASTVDRESNVGGRVIDVPVEPVDARWRQVGEPDVRLVKMDIQGGEYSALKGMSALLAACKPVIVLEYSARMSQLAGWSLQDVADFLLQLEYRYAYGLGQAGGHVPLEKMTTGVYDELFDTDIVFI
jgi:FkbM family methyltransferase